VSRYTSFLSVAVACGFVLASMSGCSEVQDFFKTDMSRFLSPDKVINSSATGSPINPIYSSVGPTDITQELVPNATFPREGDWEYMDTDYVIGPTDVVDISILDLFQEGLETTLRREVSASGFISLPLLKERILAEGLTQEGLKEAIIRAYDPDVLVSPTVSVTIAARRRSTFSILGAVSRPGPYNIVRKDMRLLEALAMAGGVTQANIQYIYVIRPAPAIRRSAPEAAKPKTGVITPEELPELPPEAPAEGAEQAPAKTQPSTERAIEELGKALPGAAPTTQPQAAPAPSVAPQFSQTDAAGGGRPTPESKKPDAAKTPEFRYVGGKWIRTDGGAQIASQPTTGQERPADRPDTGASPADLEDQADPFGWQRLDKSDLARIIAINLNKLRAGDQRMNIIVRENDIIQVPTLQVGEFYVGGEVLRPGVYTLTGRKVTVKMAITAAGGPSALAWPKNSILIRRVGGNQEKIIPLDIEAIFKGQQPDYFLKPYDHIAVGTDVRTPFMAVVRNAFRMTYGFGFIYDRNFADPYILPLDGRRFSRW